jgi:hypothetical protein
LLKHESLRFHPMPPWITKESHRPRVSDRTMSYRLSGRITVALVCFQETNGAVTNNEMEPQAGRQISPFRTAKRSNDFLNKNTRRSRVHVQTIRLNAETKKFRHRVDAAICLLTFPFIGLFRFPRLSGTCQHTRDRVTDPSGKRPRRRFRDSAALGGRFTPYAAPREVRQSLSALANTLSPLISCALDAPH